MTCPSQRVLHYSNLFSSVHSIQSLRPSFFDISQLEISTNTGCYLLNVLFAISTFRVTKLSNSELCFGLDEGNLIHNRPLMYKQTLIKTWYYTLRTAMYAAIVLSGQRKDTRRRTARGRHAYWWRQRVISSLTPTTVRPTRRVSAAWWRQRRCQVTRMTCRSWWRVAWFLVRPSTTARRVLSTTCVTKTTSTSFSSGVCVALGVKGVWWRYFRESWR